MYATEFVETANTMRKTTSRLTDRNAHKVFADIDYAAASAPTADRTSTRRLFQGVPPSQEIEDSGTQSMASRRPMLKLNMPSTEITKQSNQVSPNPKMPSTKLKEAEKNAADDSVDPNPVLAHQSANNRVRTLGNKRAAQAIETEDVMEKMSQPEAKKARTSKKLATSLSKGPLHDTGDIAGEQSEASTSPQAVIRKAPNPAAVPGRSILKKTIPTTDTSSAPFEAHTGALAGPAGRPLRRILPAPSSPNLAASTTLPSPLLPGHGTATSGPSNSVGGHGIVPALVQNSDPPDTYGQAWRSYVEAIPSQDVLKPPTAWMSQVEGRQPQAKTEQPTAASSEAPSPATTQPETVITNKPKNTGLPPYLDPHARSVLGRLLAQLPSPVSAAPVPSTTATDIEFPDMWATKKKKSTGEARPELRNDAPVEAPTPATRKSKVIELSKNGADTTSKDLISLHANIGNFKAAVGAIESAARRTASANELLEPAASTSSVSTQPGAAAAAAKKAAAKVASAKKAVPAKAAVAKATSTRPGPTRSTSRRALAAQAETALAMTAPAAQPAHQAANAQHAQHAPPTQPVRRSGRSNIGKAAERYGQ